MQHTIQPVSIAGKKCIATCNTIGHFEWMAKRSRVKSRRMGRPPTAQEAIDKKELAKIMAFYPSQKDVMDWFGVSESSLERFIETHFKMSFESLRDKSFVRTRVGIKRMQIQKAMSGDNTMLIWCGKQYLGQSEKNENVISGDGLSVNITLPDNGFSSRQVTDETGP